MVVQMNILRGSLGIRRINKRQKVRVRGMCVLKKEMDKSVLWGYRRIEGRMEE